jgi:hypothetical protein
MGGTFEGRKEKCLKGGTFEGRKEGSEVKQVKEGSER